MNVTGGLASRPELGGAPQVGLPLRRLRLDGHPLDLLLEPRHAADRPPLRVPLVRQLL